MASDRVPVYLSARSADVILSEIRPTRLKSDALQSINAFLDELLHLHIQTARSFAQSRFKDSLLRLLPTPLGREANLEAELELRNHHERGGIPTGPSSKDASPAKDFPIQIAFDLMRLKCEACTTLNEIDEDSDAESRLMSKLNAAFQVQTAIITPTVYYMTAIIEHVCTHILSSVGRVVARDSSRTSASSHDLFIALCEDETVYPLFSNMKMFEVIKARSTSMNQQRRPSLSHNSIDIHSPSRATSPVPADGRSSKSSDQGPPRSSFEKARARIFKGANSSHEGPNGVGHDLPPLPHQRSLSQVSHSRSLEKQDLNFADDDSSPVSQSFDDQLRSGETVKLSLTPDRLQSMESLKQRTQRSNSSPGPAPVRSSLPPQNVNGLVTGRPVLNGRKPSRNLVDAIAEGDEDLLPAPTLLPQKNRDETFTGSFLNEMSWVDPPPRTDSTKVPDMKRPNQDNLKDKDIPDVPPLPGKHKPTPIQVSTKRNVPRNRESLDLDDVMNGADEPNNVPMLTPKNPTAARSNANDLIKFFNDGPPDEQGLGSFINTSNTLPERKKSGRFTSMVNRLRSRASTERLPSRSSDEESNSRPPLRNKNSIPSIQAYPKPPRYNAGTTPPTSYLKAEHKPEHIANDVLAQAPPARNRTTSLPRKTVPEWVDPEKRETEPGDGSVVDVQVRKRQLNHGMISKPVPSARDSAKDPSPPSATLNAAETPAKPLPVTLGYLASSNVSPNTIVNGSKPSAPAKSLPNGHIKGVAMEQTILPLTSSNRDMVNDLREHLSRAESVVECRLLVDMFLAKAGWSSAAVKNQALDKLGFLPEVSHTLPDTHIVELLLGTA